jgi:hypothetical protein
MVVKIATLSLDDEPVAVIQRDLAIVTENVAGLAVASFDEERWQQWRARGRASDAAFAQHAGTIVIGVAGILCLMASVWSLT